MTVDSPAMEDSLYFLVKSLAALDMKSSVRKKTDFVSCIKVNGVPIPPPILTEEERHQCRLWKKEAILIEKELALKRKEKEIEKLKTLYEPSMSSHSRSSSSVESGVGSLNQPVVVIELLRDAVYNRSKKGLHILVNEISEELKKILEETETPKIDTEEFKFLLCELQKEIQKLLGNSKQSQGIIKNTDSTYNDVAHITLNQNSENPSSSRTVAEISNFPLDKKSDNNSVKSYNDVSLQSESTFKMLDECTPDDDCTSITNSLPADGSRCSFYSKNFTTSSPKTVCENLDIFKPDVENKPTNTGDDCTPSTPTKTARRNSYTLESPSPSVLAYLRNLALQNSKEKSASHRENTEQLSSAKSVVRNLNKAWEKENETKKYIDDISPGCRDSLEDVDDDHACLVSSQDNHIDSSDKKVTSSTELQRSYHELKLVQSSCGNDLLSKRMRAAITIQSYARGFLVRRLMRTYKVQQIKNTIKDAVVCAWGLYGDQAVTPSDLELHERIIQQVTAACYELHSIFFKWPTAEKMALIKSDREKLKNPKPKYRASRGLKTSESDSISLSSSRSASKSRAIKSAPSHKRTRSNELPETRRPSSSPSMTKSATLNYRAWSRQQF